MTDNNKNLSPAELKAVVGKRKKKKIILVSCITVGAIALAVAIGIIIWLIIGIRPIKRSGDDAGVVGQVQGYDIYADEFSYLVGIHKLNLEYKYGKIDWNSGSDFSKYCLAEVEKSVLEDVKKNYAVFELCKKYGVETEGDIDKAVNEEIKAVVERDFGGKKKAYKEWLEKNNLTDAYYRLVVKAGLLEERLRDALVSDGKDIKYSLKNYKDFVAYAKESDDLIRTTHVYYPKFDKYKDVNIESVKEECKNISKALLAETDTSARYEVMNDYIGACPYMVDGFTVNTLDGIYFVEGMMGEAYESAAMALDEYGVSDVVETDDGFYVIMRLPKEDEYIDKHAETLLTNYQGAKLLHLENKLASSMKFTCDDLSARILKEITG